MIFFRRRRKIMATVVPPYVYAYGDGNENDQGFGCVYRNVQTLLRLLGVPVPRVAQMMRVLNVRASKRLRDMWIEPPQAAQLLARYGGVPTRVLVFCPRDRPRNPMQRTRLEDHRPWVRTPAGFLSALNMSLAQGWPPLVDDGVASYLVLRAGTDTVLLGDPHRPSQRVRAVTSVQFYGRPLWVALVWSGRDPVLRRKNVVR